MLARIASEALSGLEGHPVEVEADVVAAAPAFSIVGLPDAAVQESRERVRAAIVNSSYEFPSRRITVNLAPADLRKEGPSFDLPIALAFLLATGQASDGCDGRGPLAAVGELGLDGSAAARGRRARRGGEPARGAACAASSCRPANAAEAALVPGLEVYPATYAGGGGGAARGRRRRGGAAGRPRRAAGRGAARRRRLRRHRRAGAASSAPSRSPSPARTTSS